MFLTCVNLIDRVAPKARLQHLMGPAFQGFSCRCNTSQLLPTAAHLQIQNASNLKTSQNICRLEAGGKLGTIMLISSCESLWGASIIEHMAAVLEAACKSSSGGAWGFDVVIWLQKSWLVVDISAGELGTWEKGVPYAVPAQVFQSMNGVEFVALKTTRRTAILSWQIMTNSLCLVWRPCQEPNLSWN